MQDIQDLTDVSLLPDLIGLGSAMAFNLRVKACCPLRLSVQSASLSCINLHLSILMR